MASNASRSGGGQIVGSIQYCPPESSCACAGSCEFNERKRPRLLIYHPLVFARSWLHIPWRDDAVESELNRIRYTFEVHDGDLCLRRRIVDALAEGIRPPLEQRRGALPGDGVEVHRTQSERHAAVDVINHHAEAALHVGAGAGEIVQ